jgi:plastocyanin
MPVRDWVLVALCGLGTALAMPVAPSPSSPAAPSPPSSAPPPGEDAAASAAAGQAPTAAAPLVATPDSPPGPRPVAPPPPPPPPGEISGQLVLLGPGGKPAAAADAIVWVPDLPARAPGAPPSMTSKAKTFTPHVVAVERGGTVVFPNVDRIYHNVFSTTAGQAFDLGLYRNGASRSHHFDAPGLVVVYCNIHPKMAGYVRVVDGAWTMTDASGLFRISDVPPGRHTVHVWHERAAESEVATLVRPARTADVHLTLYASGFRLLPHRNKYGQDYPPATLDDDRY